MGNSNNPFYRIVAVDSRSPAKGRFLETLGWYDPKLSGINFKLNMDRVTYWRENGAQTSDTVNNLINKAARMPAQTEETVKPAPAEETPAPEQQAEVAPAEAEEPTAPAETPAETESAQNEAPASEPEDQQDKPATAQA
jgi:small subunit ribosomal protein S16